MMGGPVAVLVTPRRPYTLSFGGRNSMPNERTPAPWIGQSEFADSCEVSPSYRIGRPRSSLCHKGHELTGDNVVYSGGCRLCKICRLAYEARWRAKQRLANPPKGRTYTRKVKPVVEPKRNPDYDLPLKDIARFLRKLNRRNVKKCWDWPGTINGCGYGIFAVYRDGRRRPLAAHRISYELRFGEIPVGLVIDHLCRNRACVNPFHLEPVTTRENLARGDSWKHAMPNPQGVKTHCPHGHAYDEKNTCIYTTPRGYKHRRCRTCLREDQQRRRIGIVGGRPKTD